MSVRQMSFDSVNAHTAFFGLHDNWGSSLRRGRFGSPHLHCHLSRILLFVLTSRAQLLLALHFS